MDLNLSRVDYMQVSLTHPKTMKLLPSLGGKAQQKVAIGDHEGVLQVFNMKKASEVNQVFKTLPGKEITRIEMGGALGNDMYTQWNMILVKLDCLIIASI